MLETSDMPDHALIELRHFACYGDYKDREDFEVKWRIEMDEKLTLAPEEAQMLETRQYSVVNLLRIRGLAEQVVAALDYAYETEKYDECIFSAFSSKAPIEELREALAKQETL